MIVVEVGEVVWMWAFDAVHSALRGRCTRREVQADHVMIAYICRCGYPVFEIDLRTVGVVRSAKCALFDMFHVLL